VTKRLKVRWEKAALADRSVIRKRVKQRNPSAAVKLERLFNAQARELGRFPKMGRAGAVEGTYELVVHASYVLVYVIERGEVWVLAVRPAEMDWPPGASEG